MTTRMPRGAIPAPRNELAASEPYRPAGEPPPFVPAGAFPTPNNELAQATPYRPSGVAPESHLVWPACPPPPSGGGTLGAMFAEEAFAKACVAPHVVVPPEAVARAAQNCGGGNFSQYMQSRGFEFAAAAYLDGPFFAVDWLDPAIFHAAIAGAGPVKLGVAASVLGSARDNGFALCGLPQAAPGDACASVWGYGPLAALVGLFADHGLALAPPPAMPTGLCYALFLPGAFGVVDRLSLMNVTGEAWVRVPTTIVVTPPARP